MKPMIKKIDIEDNLPWVMITEGYYSHLTIILRNAKNGKN